MNSVVLQSLKCRVVCSTIPILPIYPTKVPISVPVRSTKSSTRSPVPIILVSGYPYLYPYLCLGTDWFPIWCKYSYPCLYPYTQYPCTRTQNWQLYQCTCIRYSYLSQYPYPYWYHWYLNEYWLVTIGVPNFHSIQYSFHQHCRQGGRRRVVEPTTHFWSPPLRVKFKGQSPPLSLKKHVYIFGHIYPFL